MYTVLPNVLIDAMPQMKNSEFAVVVAVCRKTLGFQKLWDRISYSQLAAITGLTRRAVIDAVAKAVDDGWLCQKESGDSYEYKVKGAESVLEMLSAASEKNSLPGEKNSPLGSEKNSLGSEKNSPTKEIYTLPNGSGAMHLAGACGVTMVEAFRNYLELLKVEKNKSASIRRLIVELYGEAMAPTDYGRIGATAKRVGGWGYLATRLWELSSKPPNGNLLDYLDGEHRAKEAVRKAAALRNGNHGGDPAIWHKLQEQEELDYMQEKSDAN